MKISSTIIILVLFLTAASAQSLQEAVDMALKNNAGVQSAQAGVEAAELQFAAKKASRWPDFSLDASYKHVTAVPEISFPGMPPGNKIEMGLYDSYDAGLGVNYLIFSGFAQREQINISGRKKDLGLNNLQKTERDAAIAVIRHYKNVQFFNVQEQLLQAAKNRIELQLDRVKSLLANGMALAVDTLTLSLAAAQAEQDILINRTGLETTEQALQTAAGVKISPDKEINSQLPLYAEFSLNDQSAVKSIDLQKQINISQKTARESSYYPAVFAGAAVRHGKPGLDFVKKDWMTYGVVNVGLNWSLFKWGADKKEIEAVKAQGRSLDFQRQAVTDGLKLKYDQAEREFLSLKEQLSIVRKAVRLSREKMKIIENSASEGQVSVTDFNDANLELLQSELNEKKILLQIQIKASELDYLSGKPISSWSIK